MVLSPEELRTFIKDYTENNYLLDGEEFHDLEIELAMDLAISDYNMMPPLSVANREDFPSKSILLSGTLYKMFSGRSALLARNTMNYSDGGIQIPVEERAQLYQSLAAMYQSDFVNSATRLKAHLNMEAGWGSVNSDYGYFPAW